METADIGAIGNEGKHVCTFHDKPRGRQPYAPFLGLLGKARSRSIISGGRKRAWGNRGLPTAVPKMMGFRPDGSKSSGMAARTPWQAAATAAAGQVPERSGPGISSAGSVLVWQHRGAGGTSLVVIGGVFVGMKYDFVFYDRYTCRSNLIELFEIYYLRPGWRNRKKVGNICGQGEVTVNRRYISSKTSC